MQQILKINISVPILILLLANGCAKNISMLDPATLKEAQKAILFVRATSTLNLKVRKIDINNPYKKTSEISLIKPNFFGGVNPYHMAVLESGIYYISCVDDSDGSFIYKTSQKGITTEGTIIYGAFILEKGEVGYLPGINMNWNSIKNKGQKLITYTKIKEPLITYLNKDKSQKYNSFIEKLTPTKLFIPGSSLIPTEGHEKYQLIGKYVKSD